MSKFSILAELFLLSSLLLCECGGVAISSWLLLLSFTPAGNHLVTPLLKYSWFPDSQIVSVSQWYHTSFLVLFFF